MNRKAFLDISFSWIFAIIVGIFILFLAIYGLTKFTGTQNSVDTASGAKEMGILLGPLEIGFESGQTSSITMPVETKIYTRCEREGNFGKQTISLRSEEHTSELQSH